MEQIEAINMVSKSESNAGKAVNAVIHRTIIFVGAE